jgi:hypothetical protein
MEMNNEKNINEVMESLNGIQRAEANPFLYNKILNRINTIREDATPMKLVWLAAASFLLLMLLNFQALRTIRFYSSEKAELQEIASGYQLLNTNSIDYNN